MRGTFVVTNNNLQETFNTFNARFFGGRLNPGIKVMFKKDLRVGGKKSRFADAMWLPEIFQIWISDRFSRSEPASYISLLHEMVHVDIMETYVGQEWGQGRHGMIFLAEHVRLFKAGAYDGLL